MIKAGAFDSLNKNRAQLMAIYESVIEAAQCDSRKTIEGQLSLFEQNDDIMRQCNPVEQLPQVENFSHELLIAMEKEMLGVYVTGHPLTLMRTASMKSRLLLPRNCHTARKET